MNRRDILKTVGATSVLGVGAQPVSASSHPELLNVYVEVYENGDAEFVLRFNPYKDPVWNIGAFGTEPAINFEEHIQFPELSHDSVEFFSPSEEEIEVSTLVEDERAWIGHYSDDSNRSQSGDSILDSMGQWATESTLPKADTIPFGNRHIGSQDKISESTGALSAHVYAKKTHLLGGRIEGFARVKNSEEGAEAYVDGNYDDFLRQAPEDSTLTYNMESQIVFSDTIVRRFPPMCKIQFPPDVTYDILYLRNHHLSGDGYNEATPQRNQIPKLSHRAEMRLAALANGFSKMRQVCESHAESGIYDVGGYTVEEAEDAVMEKTAEALNSIMWELVSSAVPVGYFVNTTKAAKAIGELLGFVAANSLFPFYAPLIEATKDWEGVIMDYQNHKWMTAAHQLIVEKQSEFQNLEQLAYQALLSDDDEMIQELLSQMESDIDEALGTLDGYTDSETDDLRKFTPKGASEKPVVLRNHVRTLSNYLRTTLQTSNEQVAHLRSEYQSSAIPSDEPKNAGESEQRDDFVFTHDDALTITYNGEDSWKASKLFIGIQKPGQNIGFLWSNLSDATTVTTGESVTIDPQKSHSPQAIEFDSAIVDVNYEETHGTATENLARWTGPNAPDDGWDHNPSEESSQPPEDSTPDQQTDTTSDSTSDQQTDTTSDSTSDQQTDTTSDSTPDSSPEPTPEPTSRSFGRQIRSGINSATDAVSDFIDGLF